MSLLNFFSNKNKEKYFFSTFIGYNYGLQKNKEQKIHLDKSIYHFKKLNYLDAFMHFFEYLHNNKTENIDIKRETSKLNFKFIQGSKLINGFINEQEIVIEADVVGFQEPDTQIMQMLLQKNHYLKYSSFVIKNNKFSLRYYGLTPDTHPETLYKALHEIASTADNYDNFLLDKFNDLIAVNQEHIHQLHGQYINTRLNYLKNWILQAHEIVKMNMKKIISNEYANYELKILLNQIYFLISPENELQLEIFKVLTECRDNNSKNIVNQNLNIFNFFKKIQDKNDQELRAYLIHHVRSFPDREFSEQKQINSFIKEQIKLSEHFFNNGDSNTAYVISRYTLSSLPVKFQLHDTFEKLQLILWEFLYPDYFSDIENKHKYLQTNPKQINKKTLQLEINRVIKEGVDEFLNIKFSTKNIKFETNYSFLNSFMQQLIINNPK